MERPADSATEAAKYQYDDGTVEIVFAAEEGRVLTVREYPDDASFETEIEPARYLGQHSGIAELPPVEAFMSGDGSDDEGTTR
ncbi:hypothetical protein [Halobellus ordinarius]|uniref:hypothetical protein n=1 Tax=Halobellus ordinarius TaxID=3075120 RepID=UPI0028802366|nr:hypothetical protein [Halobellus sp. ZY16]